MNHARVWHGLFLARFMNTTQLLTKFAAASAGSGFTVRSSMDMESVELVKGESSMYIPIEDLVVEKVAPIFGLDPAQPLWLVRKNGNIAVFPKGNRFTGPLIASGWAYKVKQQEAGSSSPGPSSRLPQAGSNSMTPYPVPPPSTSAFGAYTGPTYSQPGLTPIPASRSKKTWRKTIILVSLTRKEGVRASKGSARVDYEVVTQVVVNLSSSACTVSAVTDLVRKQLHFDVILLDSKCYPLLGNDSTSGEGFWKSTRKVLATSRELYKKLTGQTTDPGRAFL